MVTARGSARGERDRLLIRDAADPDVADLLELWRELMEMHVSSDARFALSDSCDQRFFDYVETARARDDYRVRVAAIEGRPVGFLVCCVLPNSPVYRVRWIGYVNDICVTRAMRGRGVGRALVRDAVTWMRAAGAESVEVYVAKANAGAARFWRSVGARDYLERLSLDLDAYEGGR